MKYPPSTLHTYPSAAPKLLLAVSIATATAAPSLSAQRAESEENVVELSPFTVDASGDVGYAATNTLSGTRMNSRLKDVPTPISVYNRAFIEDIGASMIEDVLDYSVNMTPELSDTQGDFGANQLTAFDARYRVRGLLADQARNYFSYEWDQDVFNLERVEESRGPNSILFGVGKPGGVVNSTTKRAIVSRNAGLINLTIGDADVYRGHIDYNHVLIPEKLAVRGNLLYYESGDNRRPYVFREDKRAHLAVTYKPTPKTLINVEYEYGDVIDAPTVPFGPRDRASVWIESGRPLAGDGVGAEQGVSGSFNNNRVVFIQNSGTIVDLQGQALTNSPVGLRDNHFTFDNNIINDPANGGVVEVPVFASVAGPWHMRGTRDINLLTASIEQRLFPDTVVELAYASYDMDRFSHRVGQPSQLLGDPNPALPDGSPNPNAGRLYFENQIERDFRFFEHDYLRVTASQEIHSEEWLNGWLGRHQIAAMYQKRDSSFGRNSEMNAWIDPGTFGGPFHPVPDNARNRVYYRNYIDDLDDIKDWRTGFQPELDGEALTLTTEDGRTLRSGWVQNRAKADETEIETLMLAGQSFFLKDRLVATWGFRRDEFSFFSPPHFRNDVDNQRTELDFDNALVADFSSDTYSVGLAFHLTDQISILANKGTNAGISNFFDKDILGASGEAGTIAPVPSGESKDIALAFDLFDNRLFIKAAYYETASTVNSGFISWNDFNALGAINNIYDNLLTGGLIDQATFDAQDITAEVGTFSDSSEGYEFSVIANPTENWRLSASVSYNDTVLNDILPEWNPWWEGSTGKPFFQQFDSDFVLTNPLGQWEQGTTLGEAIQLTEAEAASVQSRAGGTSPGQRHYKANLFTRYDFTEGMLKNFYAGFGVRYRSGATWIQANSALGEQEFNGNTIFDGLIGWRKRFSEYTLELQLNIKNLLDDDDLNIARLNDTLSPDGDYDVFKWIATPGRDIRLTASLRF